MCPGTWACIHTWKHMKWTHMLIMKELWLKCWPLITVWKQVRAHFYSCVHTFVQKRNWAGVNNARGPFFLFFYLLSFVKSLAHVISFSAVLKLPKQCRISSTIRGDVTFPESNVRITALLMMSEEETGFTVKVGITAYRVTGMGWSFPYPFFRQTFNKQSFA